MPHSRTLRRTIASAIAVSAVVGSAVAVWSALQPPVSAQQSVRLNSLIARLEQGKTAISGADWTWIDMEHSPYLLDRLETTLAGMATAKKAGGQLLAPLVRIPQEGHEDSGWVVKQLLDMGLFGIVFPHIETKEQAVKAIRAMRYPPQRGTKYPQPVGSRGWSPRRAIEFWGIPQIEYLRRADVWPLNPEGELFAMLMVETGEGVKNINEILDVPGIGSIFIGPNDLGVSLGVGPRGEDYAPETEAAIQTVLKACKAKKVTCGIAALGGGTDLKKRVSEGFQVILNSGGGR